MKSIIVNETPVRTSKNFLINNIKLDNVEIPKEIGKFNNIEIRNETLKTTVEERKSEINLSYGLGDVLTNSVINRSNKELVITIDSKKNKELELDFNFDKRNKNLIDNINIIANEDSRGTVIIKYKSNDKTINFHNGIIKLNAKKNSKVNIVVVNLLNSNSLNFISIQNEFEENAKLNYTIIDIGGNKSISNYYSNLCGILSQDSINTIYLGNKNQVFDLNYIAELRGEKTDVNIEVQGALQVKEKVPDGVFIFLTPPDLDELRDRLSGRGTDSLEVINERMAKAREEIKLMSEYDYAVVNDEVPLAVERVKKIVEAEHFRVDRVIGRYQAMLDDATQKIK